MGSPQVNIDQMFHREHALVTGTRARAVVMSLRGAFNLARLPGTGVSRTGTGAGWQKRQGDRSGKHGFGAGKDGYGAGKHGYGTGKHGSGLGKHGFGTGKHG